MTDTLPDVHIGDPHAVAHNDERASINDIITQLDGKASADEPIAAAAQADVDTVNEYLDGLKKQTPEMHGAAGGGADDSAALTAMFAALAAQGGGAAVLKDGEIYGWKGVLEVPNGCFILGSTTRQNLAPGASPTVPGLVALDGTAQLQIGDWSSQNAPSGVKDLYVDGNFVGAGSTAKTGLIRISGNNALIDNLFCVRSAGDGIVYDGLQNSTIIGGNSTLHVGAALVLDNGPGALAFIGGYYGTSKGGAKIDRDTAGQTNLYPFGPTQVAFFNTIFEAYTGQASPIDEPYTHHVYISGLNQLYDNCNFTGGANNSDSACILINSTVSGIAPPTVTFNSCVWWTRQNYDAIRINGTGSPTINITGLNSVYDDNTHHALSFICCDGLQPHVAMLGEVQMNGSTLGATMFRVLNSGTILQTFALLDGGVVHRLRSGQVVGTTRSGDTLGTFRFYYDRDGNLAWFDGSSPTAEVTLVHDATGHLVYTGQLGISGGVDFPYQTAVISTAGTTVNFDTNLKQGLLLGMLSGGTVTTLNINNPKDARRITIIADLGGSNSITWPSNIRWAQGSPPVTIGTLISVDLEYIAGTVNTWYEVPARPRQDWSRSLDLRLPPASVTGTVTWTQLTTIGGYNISANGSTTPYAYIWNSDVTPGTWRFDIAGVTATNACIVDYDYSLDGGSTWNTIAHAVDLYNAASALKITSLGSISITKASQLLIRVSGTGTKNASSSNYYAIMAYFQALRTV